jgi:hypothetical protein
LKVNHKKARIGPFGASTSRWNGELRLGLKVQVRLSSIPKAVKHVEIARQGQGGQFQRDLAEFIAHQDAIVQLLESEALVLPCASNPKAKAQRLARGCRDGVAWGEITMQKITVAGIISENQI